MANTLFTPIPWHRPILAMVFRVLASVAILLTPFPMPAAWALNTPPAQTYRCDGEPLKAQLFRGAMDEATLADPSTAPVPIGGYVVLQWHDLSLQLPRTNNAGPASFTDGRWWWSLEDQDHPRFRVRQGLGDIQDFDCDRLDPA